MDLETLKNVVANANWSGEDGFPVILDANCVVNGGCIESCSQGCAIQCPLSCPPGCSQHCLVGCAYAECDRNCASGCTAACYAPKENIIESR